MGRARSRPPDRARGRPRGRSRPGRGTRLELQLQGRPRGQRRRPRGRRGAHACRFRPLLDDESRRSRQRATARHGPRSPRRDPGRRGETGDVCRRDPRRKLPGAHPRPGQGLPSLRLRTTRLLAGSGYQSAGTGDGCLVKRKARLADGRSAAKTTVETPAPTRRTQLAVQRREVRRDEIMKRAARLFEKKGYSQTSVGDIAQEVGMSKPTIYHYFHSKEEILYSIHDTWTAWLLSEHEATCARIDDPLEQ